MAQRSLPGLILKAALPDEPDAELLGRFVRTRDAAAFEGIVRRHGPMVWGVCRKILGDGADAEDAFQATFLVLVRRAQSVSPRGMVGNWLYGVAWRTATHTRGRRTTNAIRRRELPDVADPHPPEPGSDEAVGVVHAELAAMPDQYRGALVLCELEGRTIAEAAQLLGVAVGTVASRLARGREMLASRLRRRGWGAAALAAFTHSLPEATAARAVALIPVPGASPVEVSPAVAELSDGVSNAMFRAKLTATARVVLGVGVLAGVVTWAAAAMFAAHPQGAAPPEKPPPERFFTLPPLPGQKSWDERLWEDLGRDEPHATRAVLEMVKHSPKKNVIALFKKELRPLKADKTDLKEWIADLASMNERTWKSAYTKLDYFDPRLALGPEDAMAEAKDLVAQRRLAAILVGSADPERFAKQGLVQSIAVGKVARDTFMLSVNDAGPGEAVCQQSFPIAGTAGEVRRPTWTRLIRAVVILEHIGGDESLAILKDMATGHPDALPTKTAKEAIARLTAPPP